MGIFLNIERPDQWRVGQTGSPHSWRALVIVKRVGYSACWRQPLNVHKLTYSPQPLDHNRRQTLFDYALRFEKQQEPYKGFSSTQLHFSRLISPGSILAGKSKITHRSGHSAGIEVSSVNVRPVLVHLSIWRI